MALDLADRPDRRTILGFSPAVLIAVVAVLGAGSWGVAQAGGAHGYVDELEGACAKSRAAIAAVAAEKERAFDPNAAIDLKRTLFHEVRAATDRRLGWFEAIRVTGDHSADHAAILAGERRVRAFAEQGALQAERSGVGPWVTPLAREMTAEMDAQEARLVGLGIPEGDCRI